MVTFNPRKEQNPSFDRELTQPASLLAVMQAIQRGVVSDLVVDGEAPLPDRWIVGRRLVPCLSGLSTGHPRLVGNHRAICTSNLWPLPEDHNWARTLSRWYRLGRPADLSGLDC